MNTWVEKKTPISINRIFNSYYVNSLNFQTSSFLWDIYLYRQILYSKPVTEKAQARYLQGTK